MANLFEINANLMAAWDASFDAETGELLDENGLALIESLQMERSEKIENIACWIKNLASDEAALTAESKAFAERAKAAKNKRESLKRYLSAALNGEKFKTVKCSVSFRSSTSVDVSEDAVLPEEYIRRKVTEEPAKDEIKKALQAGISVPGCRLVEKNNIMIK